MVNEQKVRELAYLKAEKDGFRGCPVGYWVAAEKELATKKAPKAAPKKKTVKKKG